MPRIPKTILFIISFFSLLAMFFVSLVLIRGNYERPNTYQCFPDSFRISVNNSPLSVTNIYKLPNLSLSKHDTIELKRIIPDIDIKEAMLIIKTSYAAMEVFLDNVKIYSYGYTNKIMDKKLGAGFHSIQLPSDYRNKELKIILVNSGNYKLPYILQDAVLCENHNVMLPIIREYMFSFSMSIFLILFGIIIIPVFLILFLQKIDARGLAYLSLASFSIGLWSLCKSDFIRIFSDKLLINSYISYFSYYFASIPWIYMVADLKKNAGYDRWFHSIKIALFTFFFSVILLHFSGIVDYKYFAVPYSVFGVFVIVFGLFVMAHKFNYQKKHEKMLFIGNLFSAVYVILQIILFYLGKLFNIYTKELPNAFLIMISTFFLSYGYRFANNIATKKETKILKQLAYTDSLTLLGNRQSGMLKLMELDENQVDYFIILFDLNNLKITNDEYGHTRGDTLLQDFAKYLNLAFPREAVKCRIGGDEFLIIYPTDNETLVKASVEAFLAELETANQTCNDKVMIKTAYGMASTRELHCYNNELIIKKADERMYVNKRAMKLADQELIE